MENKIKSKQTKENKLKINNIHSRMAVDFLNQTIELESNNESLDELFSLLQIIREQVFIPKDKSSQSYTG